MKILLGKHERKFIRKNTTKMTPFQIAAHLGVPVAAVETYITKLDLDRQTTIPNNNTLIRPINITSFAAILPKNILLILILIIMVFGVYANSLNNAFVSDDVRAIVETHNLGNFITYVFANPFAIVMNLFYFIAFTIGGRVPIYYRLFNILFHLGNTVIIFWLLTYFCNRRVGFIAASLFAVHPLLTESVTWISGGSYTVYTFFFLFSFMLYILSGSNKKILLLSLFSYLLSLETSPKAIFFLPVFTIYEYLTQNLKRNWKKIIPFFLLSLIWVYILLNSIDARTQILSQDLYTPVVHQNLVYKIPYAISSYAFLIFWPDKLTLYHAGYPEGFSANILYLFVFTLYLSALFISFLKNRWIFFCLVFFFLPLVPTLSPISISWTVAERYVYPSSIAIFILLAILFDRLMKKYNLDKFGLIVLAIIIFCLALRTFYRNLDWRTEKSLWIATHNISGQDAKSHYNLADIYYREKKYPQAIKEYQETLEIFPEYTGAYVGLGATYLAQNQPDKAVEAYEDALYGNPDYYQAYQGLANIYYHYGNDQKAQDYLQKALKISPKNDILLENLGTIYLDMGNIIKAKEYFLKSLEVNPDNQQALDDLKKISSP